MLLYVTLEDLFGDDREARKPRPLPALAPTLAGLYDAAMRHHARKQALLHWEDDRLEGMPDWKLDRVVIRLALYARERLGLRPGDRLAVFGRLHWLWPAADFAALGQGAVAVGMSHDLSDEHLLGALAEAGPRAAFATDAESAARLLRLREATGTLPPVVVTGESDGGDPGVHPLRRVLELGGTLDTPENAQRFRAASRAQAPDASALWHLAAGAGGFARLTHAEAMTMLERRIADSPACEGDLAYFEASVVTLETRLAYCRSVGDGQTVAAFGREGRASEDVSALHPHRLLASSPWLERTWLEIESQTEGVLRRLARLTGAAWLRALDVNRSDFRAAIRARLGERLRVIEAIGPLATAVAEAMRLSELGLKPSGQNV